MIPVPAAYAAITCPYGKTGSSWACGHGGADFGTAGVGGQPVYAPWGGTVSGVRLPDGSKTGTTWGSAYGGHCVIDFDHLPDGSPGLWGAVCHLDQVHVTVGQRVEAGQTIGRVDSTGNSTGPHLHFEVQPQAGWVECSHTNPQPWLDAAGGPPPSGWLYPAGTLVLGKYLKWKGHEQNADGRSVSIGCWQDILNHIHLDGGQTLPVTEQWFEMTAGETQKHQAQFVPPPDEPLEAVFVGPQQFAKALEQSGAPYVWGG
jgi:murein DD-endopeptidase MepM/ murein hydrolase activator NlpD